MVGVGSYGVGVARSRLRRALDLIFAGASALDSRITFSRTSNATVTGSDGVLRYAPHNLLTYSEQFDNAQWTKAGVNVLANNVAAPNGALTADKIVEDTSNGTHYFGQGIPVVGTTYVFSLYAKSAGRPKIIFTGGGFAGQGFAATFNLTNGTMDTNVGNKGSIVAVGDGWYRCSVTLTATNTNLFAMYLADATGNNTYTGDGVSGIYVWGAQLEIGSTVTTYNSTTVKNLLGYTQEFDNAAWNKSNAFVQTNLLLQSSDLYETGAGNVNWFYTVGTMSSNAQVAPDGTTTGDTLTTIGGSYSIYQSATVTASTTYTASVYVKLGTMLASDYKIAVYNNTAASFIAVDVVPSQTPTSTGWTRVTYSFTTPVGCTSVRFYLFRNSIGLSSCTVHLWGAQLVQGNTPGDYTPTYSAARAVMYRAPDGTLTAEKLVENTVLQRHWISQQIATLAAGTTATFSAYVKAAERTQFFAYVGMAGAPYNRAGFYFDLATQTITRSDAGTVALGTAAMSLIGDGWYRVTINVRIDASTAVNYVEFCPANGGAATYQGDGTSGIYIWGAQLSDSASLDAYSYNPGAAPSAAAYYGPRFDYDPVTLAPRGLLIEEQRTNLLTYSEQIDNAAWTKGLVSITANSAVSPDGVADAETITADGSTGTHFVSGACTLPAAAHTFSVYLKKGTNNFAQLRFSSALGSAYANFDLNAGTVGTTSAASAIQSVGNGWYRCSMTATTLAATGTAAVIVVSGANVIGSEVNTLATSIFAWGAQLEAGAFATSYIPTTSASATRAADVATMTGANFSNWFNPNEMTIYSEAASASGAAYTGYVYMIGADTLNSIQHYRQADLQPVSRVRVGGVDTYGAVGNGAIWTGTSANKFALALSATSGRQASNGQLASGGDDTSVSFPSMASLTLGSAAGGAVLNGHIKRIAYFPRRLSNNDLQNVTA